MRIEQLTRANSILDEISKQTRYLSNVKRLTMIKNRMQGLVTINCNGEITEIPYEVINQVAEILAEKVEAIIADLKREFEAI